MHYIKLRHEIIHARYDECSGKWHLKIKRPNPCKSSTSAHDEIIEDIVDFVLMGVGGLSRWSWPDIPGLNEFKGKVLHSANWETNEGQTWEEGVKDWNAKKVGVIGVVSLFPHITSSFSKILLSEGILGTSNSSSIKATCQSHLQLCTRADMASTTVCIRQVSGPIETGSNRREL